MVAFFIYLTDTLNISFYYIYYSLSKRVSLLCTICTHIQNHRSLPIHHHKEECDIKVALRTTLLPIFSKRFSYTCYMCYSTYCTYNTYFTYTSSSLYSSISPGWQSSARHIASRVVKRTALALPVLRIERFTIDISTRSESSESDILRRASITSRFTIIAISSSVLDCH